MTPALHALFAQAQAHRLEHGCSAHPFGDGAALYDLAAKLQAKHILELGTGVGYTAVLLATACPDAQIDTLEGEMSHVQLAQDLFKRLQLEERIQLHVGSFADTLGPLPTDHYNLAFFDGHAPPLIVVRHFYELLAADGVLVCSNLRMRGTKGAPRIEAELSDKSRWQRLADIEGGNTWVLRKVSA